MTSRTTRNGPAQPTGPGHDKAAHAEQTAKEPRRPTPTNRMKRGRKDGQALEDWLNAERQLAAAGH